MCSVRWIVNRRKCLVLFGLLTARKCVVFVGLFTARKCVMFVGLFTGADVLWYRWIINRRRLSSVCLGY